MHQRLAQPWSERLPLGRKCEQIQRNTFVQCAEGKRPGTLSKMECLHQFPLLKKPCGRGGGKTVRARGDRTARKQAF